jgi:hypothetical protein
MYTRHTTFPIKPDVGDQAVEIGQRYGKVLHDLPGHVSTVMYLDGDRFTSISTWDTQEHAEAVMATRDNAQRDLVDLLSGAPSTAIVETAVHDMA